VSRSLGPALPADLLAQLSQADLESQLGRAMPFVTQDGDGTPHPMLCSYLEWLAVDATTLRLAIAAGSRSARNLEARRDWGFAGDYVRAMWTMLQQDAPDDYVIGTGESHSVREFAEAAFTHVGLDWRDHVVIDERYLRPAEVDELRADASKAARILGWSPEINFRQLVSMMVDADVGELQHKLKGGAEAIRISAVDN